MKKFSLLIFMLSSTAAHATSFTVAWGVEQYSSCTNQNFTLTLSTPTGFALLKSIRGMVNAIPSNATDTNYVRAALITFFNPTLQWATPAYATVGPAPAADIRG
jgi:hypothetical protein